MGNPVFGRDVRVVADDGTDAERGKPGELCVRGADVMLRYHEDPAATKEWCPDGWARTGDVVVATPSGLTLVGRKKDMIRRAGENISAAEVEAVLVEHPAVRAAACIAVPDALRGEEVKAYVQRTSHVQVTPEAIHAFVAERLARFKIPRYIEFVDAFPLTQSDKIAKATLIRSRADHLPGSWDAEGRWT
jgi:crotonobetaine/carnitine-CoA ligase